MRHREVEHTGVVTQVPLDLELHARSLETDEAAHATTAGRVLAVLTTDPATRFTLSDVARASGLTEAAVAAVFRMPWFAAMVRDQVTMQCASLMSKCLARLDEDLSTQDGLSGAQKIQALRAIGAVLRDLAATTQKREERPAEEALQDLMNSMKRANVTTTEKLAQAEEHVRDQQDDRRVAG